MAPGIQAYVPVAELELVQGGTLQPPVIRFPDLDGVLVMGQTIALENTPHFLTRGKRRLGA